MEGNEDEPLPAREMRGERPGKLVGGGEMDEAVSGVVGGPLEAPLRPRLGERLLGHDL